MADFIGNSVPLGRANTGAAVVLGNDGKALSIALQGQNSINAARARAAALAAKAQEKRAKDYSDSLKFNMETGRPFQEVYSEEVAPELITGLRKNELTIKDPQTLSTANARLYAEAEKERLMGTKHTQYTDAYTKTALADPEREGEYVANQFIASTKVNGQRVRPSAYDAEAVAAKLNNDPASYNGLKVAETALSKILPSSSESFAAGGRPGTFATTDSEKARFFKTEFKDGRYELVKGADKKPLLNITPDNLAALDYGRMKIVINGMEAKENAMAATTPGYKPKSRLSLLGDLVRPFASFDEKQTQNYQTVPQGRAAAGSKPVAIGFDSSPYAGDVESSAGQYDAAGKATGGFASTFAPGVGRSLTLKGVPVPVTLAANNLTYVGGDGKPNNRYEKVNADVKVDVSERVYLMTLNGKIVGAPAANATSADSQAMLEKQIDQYGNNPHARLKLFYKGTTTDKVNTRGDGVVDSRKVVGYKSPISGVADKDAASGLAYMASHPGKILTPIYDETTTERQTVYAPASIRGENAIIGHAKAAKADYDPKKLNDLERAVVDRARKNGVIVEDPYTKSTPLPSRPPAAAIPAGAAAATAANQAPPPTLKIGAGRAAVPTTKRKAVATAKRPLLPDGTVDYAAEAEMKMTKGDAL